jgi:peptidoglycan/LPS O-acetylase OafA/YrhL
MNSNRKKFHTLDALRFFAFFGIFLLHIPINTFPVFYFIKNGGGTGVTFFFVLSGFLITYIILEEKQRTSTINLSHLFFRRILRIWPLFYLMILFAFLTPFILSILHLPSSAEGYQPNWLMSVLFLENYKMIHTGTFPDVSPLRVMWSLCVEEHFYLLWGIALYLINIRKVFLLIIFSIIIANISRYIFYIHNWETLDISTNIDYFAFGAIPALLLVKDGSKTIEFINRIPLAFKLAMIFITISYVIISPVIIFPFKDLIEPSIFGLLFCAVIFFIIPENNSIKISDRNILSVLGIFTYGLYLTHTIAINFFLRLFEKLGMPLTSVGNSFLLVIFSLALTIVASILSYNLIEKPFLNLKKYFR